MTGPQDPFDLARFLTAQRDTYDRALAELRRGRKTTHWVWFVLPQVQGLGRSATAQHYAVSGPEEARAYLAHPVLGPRLRECAAALLDLAAAARRDGTRPDAAAVLGPVDAAKLRSSMTLFAATAEDPADATPFRRVLEEYFDGEPDPATLTCLRAV